MVKKYGFMIFCIVLLFISNFFIKKQDERDYLTKQTGKKAQCEIVEIWYRKRGHRVKAKFYNEILKNCVIEEFHVKDNLFKPTIFKGERYLIFYDEENSFLSTEDVLVDYTENSIEISDEFYKTSEIENFSDLNEILPEVCPSK